MKLLPRILALVILAGCGPESALELEELGSELSYVPLPGRIQAENYRAGGEGVGYHDTSAGNAGSVYRSNDVDIQATSDVGGGYNVGWIAKGEWLAYNIQSQEGTYDFEVRVASSLSGWKSFHLQLDGQPITSPVSFDDASGWQSWKTITIRGVKLTAGAHVLRLVTATGGFNFNWISATLQETPANAVIKPVYGGLYTSREANRTRWSPALGQYWLKVRWADLEPSPGVYNWAPITDYLTAHPGVRVRLHIEGGDGAPSWLANDSGAFVPVTNNRDSITRYCGRYWVPAYKNRFKSFVTALGARFDKVPEIASVNNFGNSLVYDEPWIMGGDAASVARLYSAGLNRDSSLAAQKEAIAALIQAFPTTVIEMPGHGTWDYPVDATGKIKYDWAGGRDIFNQMHALYGRHIIFTDYGLGPNEGEAAAADLATAPSFYSWLHKRADLGYPIAFQLTLTTSGSSPTTEQMVGAMEAAVFMGASWVEHSEFMLLNNSQVQFYDGEFKANVPSP